MSKQESKLVWVGMPEDGEWVPEEDTIHTRDAVRQWKGGPGVAAARDCPTCGSPYMFNACVECGTDRSGHPAVSDSERQEKWARTPRYNMTLDPDVVVYE